MIPIDAVSIEPNDEIGDIIAGKQGFATQRKLAKAKLPYVIKYVKGLLREAGYKLVLFAHHREVIQELTKVFGDKCVTVYGGTNEEDRASAQERFTNDPKIQLFIGSIETASMGINLSVSNHILFVEFNWREGIMEQARDRCGDYNKQGEDDILIEYMVFKGSYDFKKLAILEAKANVSDKVMK